MNKTTSITLVFLLLLTITSALFSQMIGKSIVHIILGLSALKFLGVAFQFMELKKAHLFWKLSLLGYLTLFIILTLTFL